MHQQGRQSQWSGHYKKQEHKLIRIRPGPVKISNVCSKLCGRTITLISILCSVLHSERTEPIVFQGIAMQNLAAKSWRTKQRRHCTA